ncbi:MAG TPA: zf-HC2 domain-containing protein [Nocardioides sp.]
MIGPIGHVGSRVGALVDGQLPAAESERLWAHVVSCEQCRDAVEREGWVKTRLAGLRSDGCQPAAPNYLHAVLCQPPNGPEAPETTYADPAGRRRAVTVAFLGAGSVGVAVVGVMALTVPAQSPSLDRRGPATSISRVTEGPASAVPVTATGGSVSATLSNATAQPGASMAELLPEWVRITK